MILVHVSNHMALDGEQTKSRSCFGGDDCDGVATKQCNALNKNVLFR